MSCKAPIVYLLPNFLGEESAYPGALPSILESLVPSLDHLIAESEKGGRRFLKQFSFPEPKTFREIPIHLLNEHTSALEKKDLIKQIELGGRWGVISDAGMPCLADPGADLVKIGREEGIAIEAFAGPSSITLALVLSGLGGQKFAFHGYLPREEQILSSKIKSLELASRKEGVTQLFIEAPYRNQKLFSILLEVLEGDTLLSVACDLTLVSEQVQTESVRKWKGKSSPNLHKRPCVFLLCAKP